MENSLKSCCDHISLLRENLVQIIASETNDSRLHRLNLAIEQLNNYETIINQRLQLLMRLDPLVDHTILISSFVKIDQWLTDFEYSFNRNKEPNKFINYQSINGYVK